MGNGKKNRPGGLPKQKGRLQAALVQAQAAQAKRAKEKSANEAREERSKYATLTPGEVQAAAQLKKKRKLERQAEGKEALKLVEVAGGETNGDEQTEDSNVPKVVSGSAVSQVVAKRLKRNSTIPFATGEHILLIGEGNFSFAHSLLLLEPPVVSPNLIIATSYDSEATALEKYPDLMEHVNFIRRRGGIVIFKVDATDLKKCKDIKQTTPFDKVVFNFPHVGSGITDQGRNVRANQTLLLNFFRSIAPFLRKGTSNAPTYSGKGKVKSSKSNKRRRNSSKDSDDDEDETKLDPDDNEIDNSDVESELEGENVKSETHHFAFQEKSTSSGTILLTLRTALPYSLWCAPHLGTRGKLLAPSILPRPLPTKPQPTYAVVRSFEFHPEDYPVYEHRRTIGYKEGVSSGKNEDLALTARERGEKRRVEKEGLERAEKEHRQGKELGTRGGVKGGAIRTWEFELVPEIDVDDAYD